MNYRKFLSAAVLAIASSATQAQVEDAIRNADAEDRKSTTHTLSLNMGPAWVTSKMYTPRGTYKWRTGLELGVEYNCVFKKGYGFGFSFLHNTTNYPDGNTTQNYVGPSFVYAGNFSRKWRGMTEVGVGYSTFNNGYTTSAGFGSKYSVGLEYMLSDKIGINAKLTGITTFLDEKEDDYGGYGKNEDEISGVVRLAFQLGTCFHF